MATSTLSNFKGALEFGGARPSLFEMRISGPTDINLSSVGDMLTHCNVSAIPPLTVTPIERQYFGRTVKIPGDMVFGDLNTTIINNESFSIRNDIDRWMERINTHVGNIGYSDNESWVGELTLKQYIMSALEFKNVFYPYKVPTRMDHNFLGRKVQIMILVPLES